MSNTFDYTKVRYGTTIYTHMLNGNEITVQQLTIKGIEIIKPDNYTILAKEFGYFVYRKKDQLFYKYDEAKDHILNNIIPSSDNKNINFVDKIYYSDKDVINV